MSPAVTRRRLVQGGAIVLGATVAGIPASARAGGAGAPTTFDAEAFVDNLLAAGCRVSVQQPIGRDAGPAFVWVARTAPDGTPTAGEREVCARWGVAIAACPDAEARILAVCQRWAERHREDRARRLDEMSS